MSSTNYHSRPAFHRGIHIKTVRAVRGVLWATLFLILLAGTPVPAAQGEEVGVPNGGSPYKNPHDLKVGQILHVPTGIEVPVQGLMDTLSRARVIYVGETHDNLEAHRIQNEIIRELHRRNPGKVAVGMEMLRRDAQPQLDAWTRGELEETEFKQLFSKNWGRGYSFYEPIFSFLHDNRLPLLGLKSSRIEEALLREQGKSAPGLPEMVLDDPYHKTKSMAIFGAHSEEGMEKPYQMLTLWEEAMADSVAQFLRNPDYADYQLVVLAGGFHVQYGFGIPKRAFRRVAHAYQIVLPTIIEMPEDLKESREMDVQPTSVPLYSADFLWVVDYIVPEKRKILLGVMLQQTDEGLKVRSVSDGSNAAQAGILKDDILTHLDGKPIANFEDFTTRLQEKNLGDTAEVGVLRGGEARALPVVLHAQE